MGGKYLVVKLSLGEFEIGIFVDGGIEGVGCGV